MNIQDSGTAVDADIRGPDCYHLYWVICPSVLASYLPLSLPLLIIAYQFWNICSLQWHPMHRDTQP